MVRPVFVFDADAWLDVTDGSPTDYYEEIDVEGDEFTAFDIDGQLLEIVGAPDDTRPATSLREGQFWVFAETGTYDLPRLLELARRHAAMIEFEPSSADELLELANHQRRLDWQHANRPRRLLGRSDECEPFEPYTRE